MDVFPIIPASSTRWLWAVVVVLGVVLIGSVYVLVRTIRGAQHSSFEVSGEGLRLRGDIYGRLIPPTSIRFDGIRVVDMKAEPELALRSRTAGTATSGYHAGWFTLRNGERALIYLTDRSRVIYIPTTEGYSLLLSTTEPARMAERLRGIATN